MADMPEIGVKLTLDGEKQFKQAISDIDSNMKVLVSESGKLSAQYEKNSKSAEALRAKTENLSKQVEAQKEKLSIMRQALDAANKRYKDAGDKVKGYSSQLEKAQNELEQMGQSGKANNEELESQKKKIEQLSKKLTQSEKAYRTAGRQVNDWQRKLNNSERDLAKLEGALDESNKALSKAEKFTERYKNKLKELGDKYSGVISKAKTFGGALGKGIKTGVNASIKAITALTAGATAAGAALVSAAESTRDYRTEMGKLEVAYSDRGHSADDAQKAYKDLVSIIGETDRSVEAASHLAELTNSEKELAAWTGDILPGVFAKFGDSLPLENLTEASNETAKVGKVTGGLADALNWAGVSEDAFNKKLEECSSEQERQTLITQTLSDIYSDASESYKKANKEVIEANRVNEELTSTIAKLGAKIDPVLSKAKSFGASILQRLEKPVSKFADSASKGLERLEGFLKSATAYFKKSTVQKTIKKLQKQTSTLFSSLKKAVSGTLKPLLSIVEKVVGFIANSKLISSMTKIVSIVGKITEAGLKIIDVVLTPLFKILEPLVALIDGVLGGIAELIGIDTDEFADNITYLSEAEQQLADSSKAAAEAYSEVKKAASESASAELANVDYTERLWEELDTLTEKNGKVKAGYEDRAAFILGQLNDALGTEYSMNKGIIDQYGDLRKSIDNVIRSKRAQILLEAHEDTYSTAVKNIAAAEKDRADALAAATKKQQEANEILAEYNRFMAEEFNPTLNDVNSSMQDIEDIGRKKKELEDAYAELQGAANELNGTYVALDETVQQYYSDIATYEEASAMIMQGNVENALGLLSDLSSGYETAASAAEKSADEQKKVLEEQVVNTEIQYQLIKQAFENGAAGVTEFMVADAKKKAEEAKSAYAGIGGDIVVSTAEGVDGSKYILGNEIQKLIDNAVYQADTGAFISVGKDSIAGYVNGVQSMASNVFFAVESVMQKAKDAADSSLQINSPSRVMMQKGEYSIQGFIEGAKNKENVLRAAFVSVIQKAKDAASGVGFKSIGVNAGQGIAEGLSSMRERVMASARNIAISAAQTIKKALDIHSPSKLLREYGQQTGEGFALGLDDKVNKVKKISGQLAAVAAMTAGASAASSQTVTNNYNFNQAFNGQYTARDGEAVFRDINRRLGQTNGRRYYAPV